MGALHNNKWEKACQVYVAEGLSKSDAYRAAYPASAKNMKPTTIHVRASELFKRKRVQARIKELEAIKEELANEEFKVNAEYVLRRHYEIDQMDVLDILDDDGNLKPVQEWPKVWRQFVSSFDVEELFAGRGDERLKIGLLKKIKWPDKVSNLKLLGSHIDVGAYKEIKDHRSGDGSMQPTVIEIIAGGPRSD